MAYKTIRKPLVGVVFVWFAIWLYPNSLMYGMLPFNLRLDDLFLVFTFLVCFIRRSKNQNLFTSKVFILSFSWWIIHIISNVNGLLYLDVSSHSSEVFKFIIKAAYVPISVAIVYYRVNTIDDMKFLLKGIMVAGIFTAAIGIGTVIFPEYFSVFLIPDLELGASGLLDKIESKTEILRRASGSLGIVSTSIVCAFITILSFLSLISKEKHFFKTNFSFAIFILVLFGLFFTQSRGPIIATSVVIGFILVMSKRKKMAFFVISIIGVILVFSNSIANVILQRFSGESGSSLGSGAGVRSSIWIYLLENLDPILLINGVGMIPLMSLYNATAHNTYLGSLIYGGIWGVLWFVILILFTFKLSRNLVKSKFYEFSAFMGEFVKYAILLMLMIGISVENFQQTISMQLFLVILLIGEKMLKMKFKKPYTNMDYNNNL